jgi:hypothetical protein
MVMINHNAMRLFMFLLRCGPEAAIFVALKMEETIVTEKRKQKRALHCG